MSNNINSLFAPAFALALVVPLVGCSADEDPFAVSTREVLAGPPGPRFRIPAAAQPRTRIETAEAGPATLVRELMLPGRVRFDEERRAAIVARVEGVVAETHTKLGDQVERGDLLAVLHSRELARARSAYIEAAHVLEFSRTAFEREERLWKKGITPEESFLQARHHVEEARLGLRTSGQELQALGVGREELSRLSDVTEHLESEAEEVALTRFERRSPTAGIIVAKSVVLGEAVKDHSPLFEVADLSTVWVDVHVRAADLGGLSVGCPVTVASGDLGRERAAEITYLDPQVDPDTQTALARVFLENDDGAWRPGLYVTVRAQVGEHRAAVAVPAASVHSLPGLDGERHIVDRVFVSLGEGEWEAREVRLGKQDGENCEVVEGLRAGEVVAVGEGLVLKSAWLGQGGRQE